MVMLGKCFLLFWHFFSFPFSLFVHLSVFLPPLPLRWLCFVFVVLVLEPGVAGIPDQTPSPSSAYRHVCFPLCFKVNRMVLFPSQSSPSLWARHIFPWCQIHSTHFHTCLFIMSKVPHTRSLHPKPAYLMSDGLSHCLPCS